MFREAAALGCLLLPVPVLSNEKVDALYTEAVIQLVSDYHFYGVSSSNGKPVLQAYVHIEHRTGWYGGAFASSVDFEDPGNTRGELDVYAGRTFPAGPFEFRTELTYIAYDEDEPGPTWDFWSGNVSASTEFDRTFISLSLSHTEEGAYASGANTHLVFEGKHHIKQNLNLVLTVGHSVLEYQADATYWEFGAALDWRKLSFSLVRTGSDRTRAECEFTDWCRDAWVGTAAFKVY